MVQINLKSVGVSLDKPLFSNVNLTIAAGDRLGIVAANGRGKTTLLRAISGQFEPTEGDITRARSLTLGQSEQHLPTALEGLTFYDAVRAALSADAAENESWRVDILLDDLGIPAEFRERTLSQLSGGWRRM
ncbi:ABC-F family ATP-binding cassette domain-containing protein, partial [Salmonella enterica subsp. enterica]|nr:ABC-F family ATP-binding cassette domain-containing protein [Salmonella enterica subsp. enterica serovar Paratyphi A]